MRVGVDIGPLLPPFTGVANYEYYLLEALTQDAPDLHLDGFYVGGWTKVDRAYLAAAGALAGKSSAANGDHGASPALSRAAGLKRMLKPLARRTGLFHRAHQMLRRLRFESSVTSRRLDLFHAFNFRMPGVCAIPYISTIYDLSFVRYPQTHMDVHLRFLEPLGRELNNAAAIHTISEFTAREIVDVFGANRSKIFVIRPGVGAIYREAPRDLDATLAKYRLHRHCYALTVSTLEPRKNLKTLIEAYARLSADERLLLPLCVAGPKGWGDIALPPHAAALEREGCLRFLGYVPDNELRDLYHGTRVMLYPSIYEGFGMPVIEALACGAPAVASNVASLPEAVGSVADLIEPLDLDGWSMALRRSLDNHGALSEDRRHARMRHAQSFTWEAAANATLQMYEANVNSVRSAP